MEEGKVCDRGDAEECVPRHKRNCLRRRVRCKWQPPETKRTRRTLRFLPQEDWRDEAQQDACQHPPLPNVQAQHEKMRVHVPTLRFQHLRVSLRVAPNLQVHANGQGSWLIVSYYTAFSVSQNHYEADPAMHPHFVFVTQLFSETS